ncbi:MAG TPA: CGGC domain-containing protein [Selenomonadales bacterium]|nr:CGGC domain-containing protein [Selenomonadales bacterium]
MLNVAVIGCPKTSDPGWIMEDLQQIQSGSGPFQPIGPAKLLGFVFCGGCPGKSAVVRARMLARAGADILALSSGLGEAGADGFTCPHRDRIKRNLEQHLTSVIILGGPAPG